MRLPAEPGCLHSPPRSACADHAGLPTGNAARARSCGHGAQWPSRLPGQQARVPHRPPGHPGGRGFVRRTWSPAIPTSVHRVPPATRPRCATRTPRSDRRWRPWPRRPDPRLRNPWPPIAVRCRAAAARRIAGLRSARRTSAASRRTGRAPLHRARYTARSPAPCGRRACARPAAIRR